MRHDQPRDPAGLLRSHGLNVTAQRLAVLRAVCKLPHSPAEAIETEVRAALGTVSKQAIYDVLGALTDKGIVRRVQPAGSPALYDPRVGDTHHHAICRTCGAVVDVDCAVGSAPCLTAAAGSGFEIEEAEVVYWGTCPACRKRKGKAAT